MYIGTYLYMYVHQKLAIDDVHSQSQIPRCDECMSALPGAIGQYWGELVLVMSEAILCMLLRFLVTFDLPPPTQELLHPIVTTG